jgi:hypothetical protein
MHSRLALTTRSIKYLFSQGTFLMCNSLRHRDMVPTPTSPAAGTSAVSPEPVFSQVHTVFCRSRLTRSKLQKTPSTSCLQMLTSRPSKQFQSTPATIPAAYMVEKAVEAACTSLPTTKEKSPTSLTRLFCRMSSSCQRKSKGFDCGFYAIAIAVSLAFGQKPIVSGLRPKETQGEPYKIAFHHNNFSLSRHVQAEVEDW